MQLRMQPKGFTLIELLVVIAIIGLLASIVSASLAGARKGALDAQRVSELNEMVKTILRTEIENPGTTLTGTGCANASRASNCTLLANYTDPSGNTNTCVRFPPTSAVVCDYTIFDGGAALSTSNFKICAYLEKGTPTLPAGNVQISSTTLGIRAGC